MTIDDILLPGTPASVRDRYASLAERAAYEDFGLLEEDIVVLDTETTGLSFRDCELIQIAAARIEDGQVAERFDTFVHPGRPIPPQIPRLGAAGQLLQLFVGKTRKLGCLSSLRCPMPPS